MIIINLIFYFLFFFFPGNSNEECDEFLEAVAEFPNCGTNYNSIFHPGDLSGEIMKEYTRYTEYFSSFKDTINELTVTENPKHNLSSLLEKTETKYSLIPVPSKRSDVRIVILNIDSNPALNVYGYGNSYSEASKKAAVKALEFIKILSTPTPCHDVTVTTKEEFENLIEAMKLKLND